MEDKFLIEEKLRLERQLKSAANWFFAIAGLSVVNSLVLLLGGSFNFIVGLGITQLTSALAHNLGPIGKSIAFVISVIAASVFVIFGVLARKRHKWAFVVGMILYACDGLLFLLVSDWIGIAFHLYVLYRIYKGIQMLGSAGRLEADTATGAVP
jgi:hypothetical protein